MYIYVLLWEWKNCYYFKENNYVYAYGMKQEYYTYTPEVKRELGKNYIKYAWHAIWNLSVSGKLSYFWGSI